MLYSFRGGNAGSTPSTPLDIDSTGALYGATTGGGSNQSGMIFRLKQIAPAIWTETVLASLPATGQNPNTAQVALQHGVLYVSIYFGGPYGAGAIYRVTP